MIDSVALCCVVLQQHHVSKMLHSLVFGVATKLKLAIAWGDFGWPHHQLPKQQACYK